MVTTEMEYDRARNKLPHRTKLSRDWQKKNREKANEIKRKWAMNNRDKIRAQHKLAKEIEMGRVIHPTQCQECGCVGPVEGHHDDYSKPLDVRWVCDPCHKSIHVELRRKKSACERGGSV